MDEKYSSIKGIYRDILKDHNGKTIFDSGWVSNIIVNGCHILLAAFMKNDQTKQVTGIQCLKVGKGSADWDDREDGRPPPPLESETGLVDENPFAVETEELHVVFLNDSDVERDKPSNRLQISTTLGVKEPEPPPGSNLSTYPLREFGLFGKYVEENGTEHEYMIDCIRHPVMHKDISTTLIRVVRLYF